MRWWAAAPRSPTGAQRAAQAAARERAWSLAPRHCYGGASLSGTFDVRTVRTREIAPLERRCTAISRHLAARAAAAAACRHRVEFRVLRRICASLSTAQLHVQQLSALPDQHFGRRAAKREMCRCMETCLCCYTTPSLRSSLLCTHFLSGRGRGGRLFRRRFDTNLRLDTLERCLDVWVGPVQWPLAAVTGGNSASPQ